MDSVILKWNKDLSQAPSGLLLIKIAVHSNDGIAGVELALAYRN